MAQWWACGEIEKGGLEVGPKVFVVFEPVGDSAYVEVWATEDQAQAACDRLLEDPDYVEYVFVYREVELQGLQSLAEGGK